MKYYIKIFLLSVAIAIINILIYAYLLQFQIVHNSSYIPQEAGVIFLIVVALPVQFLILLLIGFIFKRNQLAIAITSVLFIVVCFYQLWSTSVVERRNFDNEQVYNRTEKYDYEQGISTPEGYPIKLLPGSEFTIAVRGYRGQYTYLETDKVYSEQWGNGDCTFKSSDAGGVALPDGLKLSWYSFLENKYYYELNTKLDKTKISDYFKKGYRYDYSGRLNKISQTTYDKLIVGIAPAGDVVLWISSFNDTKELEIFKAKEINLKKIHKDDVVNEKERKEVLNDTCTCENDIQFRKIVNNNKSIPFGVWANKYRKKFNWKIVVNNFGQTKTGLSIDFFNGEESLLYNEEITKMNCQKQSLPDNLMFTFIKNEKKYKAYLLFNENEIFSHFEKLTQNNLNEPIEIVLNISSNLKQTTIKLHSKDRTLNFEKMKDVDIYAD
jgi:hypothetical protein